MYLLSCDGTLLLHGPLKLLAIGAFASVVSSQVAAQTVTPTLLADQPVLSSPVIPGNLVMALSVEFPTGVSVAHNGSYDTTRRRLGYFDPNKCYSYHYDAVETRRYFQPAGAASNFTCNGLWSGSFLNWATMQTIDPFRWALTGGQRVIDTTSMTVIEKAYASGQGGTGNFPNRSIGNAYVSGATPFNWTQLNMRIQGLGVRMRFTATGNVDNAPIIYTGGAVAPGIVYEVSVRVRVCDSSAGTGGVESNCKLYGSNYKPEGLIQQYADRIRYSAFGYLNDGNLQRDGGVLRARQKFVGPLEPRPSQSSIINPVREWDSTTGIQIGNPDTADATAFGTSVANSGVINYLNKFGQSGSYKGYDPVGELYYAAIRYLKNLGNVNEWTATGNADANTRSAWADAFPVITNWGDPVQYSCQSNFVLGIGDVNTHADKNVPGASALTANEPTKPAQVTADTSVNEVSRTNAVGLLEGIGNGSLGTINTYNACCNNNSAMMAGLAYDSHVRDIRSDLSGMQTVKTFWVDVLEGQQYRKNNQYYLATKYGGFTVPDNFNPDTVTAATFPGTASWNSNGQTLDVGNTTSALTSGTSIDNGSWGVGANRRPDSYFTAGTPDTMVAGLTEAFSRISSDLRAATTSFSLPSPQVETLGNSSFSASYLSGNWTGTLVASSLDFNTDGSSTRTQRWTSDTELANQLANTGWNGSRRVVTYRPDLASGVPFRASTSTLTGISATQLLRLDTPYVAGTDGATYLNYLRGERTNEVGQSSTALGYRARAALLGDISGSKVTAVAAPNSLYSDAANPGYAAFVAAQSNRPTMVYVGANDGMMHAFNGNLNTALSGGQEVFAYVPAALFAGPSACTTPSSCAVDALASRGNPIFEHRPLVDATPKVFDIDFARSNGSTVAGNPDPVWRSVLIGGLGKGGRSYYAINVTDPGGATTESQWAQRVLWEFPDAQRYPNQTAAVQQIGYSYGPPVVTKTAKYGWVVVFASGYNSPTGGNSRSYLFFVNPRTGELLETVTVGRAIDTDATEASDGLAYVRSFVLDFRDNTAESLYAGDLLGNIWRVDLRGREAYSAVNIARLTAADGTRQPVTTQVLVEVDPASSRRYVLAGTGRLLDGSDIGSTAPQTFYAIVDGTRTAFSTVTSPITRSSLVENTSTTLTGNGVTATATSRGWFLELGTGTANRAWRMVLDPVSSSGRIAFATLLADGGVCSSDNSSRDYLVDFGKGQSVLLNADGTSFAYNSQPGVIIDIKFLCRGSSCTSNVGLQNGALRPPPPTQPIVLPPLRRLNWRELQVVQ